MNPNASPVNVERALHDIVPEDVSFDAPRPTESDTPHREEWWSFRLRVHAADQEFALA